MNRLSWIFIFTTFVIIALISFLIIRPIATSSWQIYQQNKQAKQDLADAAKKKEILDNLSKNDKLNTIFNIASSYIPVEQKSGDLVIELTAIANQSNLKVEQFSFDSGTSPQSKDSSSTNTTTDTKTTPASTNSTTSGDIGEIKFSIKLNGTFSNFVNFLKGTETSSRLVSVTAMDLSQAQNVFSAQLTGKTYWKKATIPEKTVANIDIPQVIIDKFLKLKTYGSPINLPSESGFGRTDPFAGY